MKRIMLNVTENALEVLKNIRNTPSRVVFLQRLFEAIDAGKENFYAVVDAEDQKKMLRSVNRILSAGEQSQLPLHKYGSL